MTNELLETTMRAFEDRMAMRRKMLKLTGVTNCGISGSQKLEDLQRESVENCVNCKEAEACKLWLIAADSGVDAPDFCPNAQAIREFKAMQAI